MAQFLEYDIATQAGSVAALLAEAEQIIAAYILVAEQEGLEPFANIPRAPRRFWQMYKDAKPVRHNEPLDERHPVLELRAA